MPTTLIDGIATRYEVVGSGPPLLMHAPGGFNAVVEAWSTLGVYQKIKLLDHLPAHFTCILFDRRECGQSGGRVEPITWSHYVAQGKGLLEHLRIARAHLMGGCMGCAPVAAFAVAYPDMVASLVLYWPVGGAWSRSFARRVSRSAPIRAAAHGPRRSSATPILPPLMRDKIPNNTLRPARACATPCSTATLRLEECLPQSSYWDAAVEAQTEAATNPRLLEFLRGVQL